MVSIDIRDVREDRSWMAFLAGHNTRAAGYEKTKTFL